MVPEVIKIEKEGVVNHKIQLSSVFGREIINHLSLHILSLLERFYLVLPVYTGTVPNETVPSADPKEYG